MPLTYDPYLDAKEMAIFREVPSHDYEHVNAGEIVGRILRSREAFAERQRKKERKPSERRQSGEERTWRGRLLKMQGPGNMSRAEEGNLSKAMMLRS